MPTIKMLDGKRIPSGYHRAVEIKKYLDNPELLETDFPDPKVRAEKQQFLELVEDIDFSDLNNKGHKRLYNLRSEAVKAVLADPSLKGRGKAKWRALGEAIRNKEGSGGGHSA